MNISGFSSKESFLFEVSGVTAKLSVVAFTALEKISYHFTNKIEVATSAEIKSFDDIIGNESLLTLINKDLLAGDRYFHGVVRKFEYTGMNGRKFLYEAEVVPTMFLLSLRKNCRIFQGKNVQDIIRTILKESGILSNQYRFALKDEERKRGFCVQYQETDLEFINRIMREEGIYYFFEHYKDKHVLVISDYLAVHVPIAGNPLITFNSNNSMVAGKECIYSFTFSQRQASDAFAHRNFNFKKPTQDLTTKDTKSKDKQFEIYEYPALHTTEERGKMLAQVRMEALVAKQKQGHGHSSSCRLTPGYNFTLTNHDSTSLNAEYLIIEVSHAGSQPQSLEAKTGDSASYSNQFDVIPATTQFRSVITNSKPVVKGVQTAIVVGPKGEEIHTDDHGRVRVQFHWDREGKRDEKSSCWLRVSQTWGGGAWGAQFIPRIGDEVLVDFVDGDPDRPIVTGCVYNGDNKPINSLNKSVTQSGFRTKTHKGEGFNELRFDDANGAQEVYLQAQKDWNILVKNDKGQTIGGNEKLKVGKNKNELVVINKTETIGAAKELTIGGAYQVSVGGIMNETVAGAKTEEVILSKNTLVKNNYSITVDDTFTIKNGSSSITMNKDGKIEIAGKDVTFKTAEGKVHIDAGGIITIKGAMVKLNT